MVRTGQYLKAGNGELDRGLLGQVELLLELLVQPVVGIVFLGTSTGATTIRFDRATRGQSEETKQLVRGGLVTNEVAGGVALEELRSTLGVNTNKQQNYKMIRIKSDKDSITLRAMERTDTKRTHEGLLSANLGNIAHPLREDVDGHLVAVLVLELGGLITSTLNSDTAIG